jgi:methionine salvage enolase-phosphatase E1
MNTQPNMVFASFQDVVENVKNLINTNASNKEVKRQINALLAAVSRKDGKEKVRSELIECYRTVRKPNRFKKGK